MGYSTYFFGEFIITPEIKDIHKKYINAFSRTRRNVKNTEKLSCIPDPLREAVGLPLGKEGEFSLIEDICDIPGDLLIEGAPEGSYYAQWIINKNGNLCWNGGEKFYGYKHWLYYYIKKFFIPWGYKVNGRIRYKGEDSSDKGYITIKNNFIKNYPYSESDLRRFKLQGVIDDEKTMGND